jgi:polyhydroxybutyrate depolymerase
MKDLFSGRRLGAGMAVLVAAVAAAAPAASAATYRAGRTTTSGTSMYTGQQNVASATQVTTGPTAGTLSSVSVYVGAVAVAPTNHMQVALYRDSGADAPGERIAQSASQVLRPNSWNAFAMPAGPVAAGTRYWLAFNVDGYATQVPIASVAGGRTAWRYPVGFGAWPATFGAPDLGPQALQYSMYMTYTSGAVPPPPPPPQPGSRGCGTPVTPGTTTRAITVGAARRSYLLVVPAGVDANTPVPLIMGFHGGGGTAAHARQTYGLEGSEPALYVYPQAPYWPEAGGVAWNVDPSGVDLPYFDAVLAEVESRHCVATARVFAAGKSNGGFFVNALACYRPGAIRAIASVAGGGPQNGCSSSPQPKAAMIVHGTRDPTVSLSSGRYSRDFWLLVNGYSGLPPVPVDPVPCVTYPGTVNPVEWCQHDGGHDWPAWVGPAVRRYFLSLP